MLRTKFDKLLFAVAAVMCIAVAAVFVVDRLRQQNPVGNFERLSKSVSDDEELLLNAELPGRKDSPTDLDAMDEATESSDDVAEQLTVNLSASTDADNVGDLDLLVDGAQTDGTPENDATLSSSDWASCDLDRYTVMNTRLRSAASTDDGDIIDVLPLGEKVNVVARNDSWSQVLDRQGRSGYILSELLSKDKPVATNSVSVNRTRYARTDLRLRKDPGTDGEYILTITAGTKLTELVVQGSWSQVQMEDGLKGYVSNEFLTDKRPSTNQTSATNPPKTTAKPSETQKSTSSPGTTKPLDDGFTSDKKTLYATVSVNVRSGPGTGYSKITSVSRGTKLTQLSRNDRWSKVELANGRVGYMVSSYLSVNEPIQETTPPASEPSEGSGDTSEPTTADLKIKLTQDERRDVAALLYLEGGATSRACQKMIVEVIFNQWKYRGGSLTDTLYAPNLFSVANRINSTTPRAIQFEVVDDVCRDGVSIPSNVLYFRSNYYHSFGTPYMRIGNIYFSSR
ncbi:MAG TPA: SH3 domain-containing protein [Clostridiaceae bacterium]|nr:SH3 domain-containing protein [Clostridiaceae bacterium]